MAGPITVVDSPSVSNTTTTELTYSGTGAHSSFGVYVDVISIGGGDTWSVAVYWRSTGATDRIKIAEKTGITAAGLYQLPLDAAFQITNQSVPTPNQVVYTRTVAGGTPDLTGKLIFHIGD